MPASGRTADALIAELTTEAKTTRRVLERIPEDKLSWAPHPKSMTLGALALHIAVVPGAVAEFVSEPVREAPSFASPEATSLNQILTALDKSVAAATRWLSTWQDEDLQAEWRMKRGDRTIMALPRLGMLRAIMLNHWYHHRGQLTVYLRLLDVPLPSVYGPSADERPFE
jgi:uncharacterized damage-inducible protein DinB